MSEAEKKRRLDYKRNRRKWIIVIAALLGVLAVLTAAFGVAYRTLDQKLNVGYVDESSVAYDVRYFEADYFEEGGWQGPGYGYLSTLADEVRANFSYDIFVEDPEAVYYCTHEVYAKLVVAERSSGKEIYHPLETLKASVKEKVQGNTTIRITQFIDYDAYRSEALGFLNEYPLTGVDAYVAVTLHVIVGGDGDYLSGHPHDVTIKLPLIEQTFIPTTQSTVPTGAPKVLRCVGGETASLFRGFTIASATVAVLGTLFLIGFIFFTRNHDINYSIKVKRLVSSYKPFIQQMTTPFDTTGYQIVYIKSFQEMLDVRDTAGSPLLMYENEDKTATTFVIPSANGLLYSFEIRVEDYDDIYRTPEEAPVEEAPAEEAPAEEASVEETLVEEAPVEEASVEEAPVEEAPVEEAPIEESSAEEAPVEETPAAPKAPKKKKKGPSNKRKTKQVNNQKRTDKAHYKDKTKP